MVELLLLSSSNVQEDNSVKGNYLLPRSSELFLLFCQEHLASTKNKKMQSAHFILSDFSVTNRSFSDRDGLFFLPFSNE